MKYDSSYKIGRRLVVILLWYMSGVKVSSGVILAQKYMGENTSFSQNWGKVMKFQWKVLAKSLAKLHIAIKFSSPHLTNYNGIFGQKMSKFLKISPENNLCVFEQIWNVQIQNILHINRVLSGNFHMAEWLLLLTLDHKVPTLRKHAYSNI